MPSTLSELTDTARPALASKLEEATQAWYADYYEKKGIDRNDILSNPEVLFQSLAFDVANTRALRCVFVPRSTARVLDVGCGSGTSLLAFLKFGFAAKNLAGVDINSERLAAGKTDLPVVDFRCESAEQMSFPDSTFDIVFESTMFVQITNNVLARGIAADMLRVTRPGGYLVLADWRYSKPRNPEYLGVSQKRLRDLFSIGVETRLVCQKNGALVPPVGRLLSHWAPWAYFTVQSLLPFLVGQQTTVLQKSL